MEELIGRKFRRNVYGLSSWTSVIKRVSITREMIVDKKTKTAYFAPVIYIHNEKGNSYQINEIVIVVTNQKLIQLSIDLAERGKIKSF